MTSTSSITPMGAPDPAAPFIHDTVRWLEKAVIGLNLCPFARRVFEAERIRYVVSEAEDEKALLAELTIELAALGSITMHRASHVEPAADGRWFADLAPSNGPLLGPFSRRSDALMAEAAWLSAHRLNSAT